MKLFKLILIILFSTNFLYAIEDNKISPFEVQYFNINNTSDIIKINCPPYSINPIALRDYIEIHRGTKNGFHFFNFTTNFWNIKTQN